MAKFGIEIFAKTFNVVNDVETNDENNSMWEIGSSDQTIGDPVNVQCEYFARFVKKKQINSYFSDMTDVSGMYEWPHSESETELNWPAIIIRFLEHNTTF